MLKIKENVPLKNYTTFKIGGRARYFFEAKSKEDLIEAVEWAKQTKTPFFILGGGSNLLVSDKGYNGLLIKIQMSKVSKVSKDLSLTCPSPVPHLSLITVEAGAQLEDLIDLTAEKGHSGLEWAAGIPQATVGGAVHNNAGAFENTIEEIVENVEVFDAANSKIKTLSQGQCGFGYKQTIFKQNKNLIILSCCLNLRKGNPKQIKEKIAYVSGYREKNHPMDLPSAGCIFVNSSNVSAAELIDKSGLKGKRVGDAQISPKHANFIVNLGKASSTDVLALIDVAQKKVKKQFDIALKEEIQYLPPHQTATDFIN